MDRYEEAAKSFNKAMKGFGTDEARIIREVTSFSKAERQIIKGKYCTMYGHTLEEDLKKEISGHFLKGVLALLMPTEEYEAQCCREAIKGIGTNCRVLIHILCTKEASEIQSLKAAYRKIYDRDLEKDLEGEEGGPLGRIFRSLAQGVRPSSTNADLQLAKKEAQELYDAGQGKIGTDEIEFVRVLCSRSFAQLRATFNEYYILCKTEFEKAIKKEMSGNLEKACLAIVKSAINKPAYFAEELYESMKGVGTRDDDLVRLLVCRSEIDLPQIKVAYKAANNKSLYDAVKSELSGDYEKLFLTLIGKD